MKFGDFIEQVVFLYFLYVGVELFYELFVFDMQVDYVCVWQLECWFFGKCGIVGCIFLFVDFECVDDVLGVVGIDMGSGVGVECL